ncbi:MAG: class I tRNA ligase family protein, partial [Oscillospiraceae bacterium]
MKYEFTAIEKKWQKKWQDEKTYACQTGGDKPKFYGLVEFPYPSGQGLHVGHARPYTAMDVVARKKRMDGYNVLFPMGYDAFGLPTENYAIKNHIHPAQVTHDNVQNFTEQLKMLGYSFDWDRVINTTDPEYYKWTQWIF